MIRVLALLVLLFMPFPAAAIPSPDFLGPILAWMAAMTGIASAFFGVMVNWVHRYLKPMGLSRRWAVGGLFLLFTVGLILILTTGLVRYERLQFAYYRDLFRDHATAPTTTLPVPTPTVPPTTTSTFGNPLSSRAPDGQILVSTDLLRIVVSKPNWQDDLLVLDIREPEERLIGFIPVTSTVMRYGDLINGGEASIPKDRDILVICWTSMRGSEVATWLRLNGFPRAYAIQGGLQGDEPHQLPGWIASGLPWQGDDKWSDRFVNFDYLTLPQAKALYDKGAIVIDTRDIELYNAKHIKNAAFLPIKYQSSAVVSSTIATFAPKKPLLVYCSGWVDCFYARIIGERLKALGWSYTLPYRDDAGDWFAKGYPAVRGQ